MSANRDYAERIARALARALDDAPATVSVIDLGALMGTHVYAIEVAADAGAVMVFAPGDLSADGSAIHARSLIAIRQRMGEDIDSLPEPTPAYKTRYDDVIATDALSAGGRRD